MWRNAQIAVIIPAYNEAEHIGLVLRSLPAYIDRILVVDDGSQDATQQQAEAVRDPRVRVIRHANNAGVGMALCTGYRQAFAEGADVVAVMAGDGQMHPDDLVALLTPVVGGEADYAKGDRLSHPEVFRRMPFARWLGNQVLSFCTRLATGLSVRDSQCGYTALHRRAAERLTWHELWRGYGYPNDLLGRLAQTGARVCDVAVRPVYADEKSGIRLRHALFVIPFVLACVCLRRARLTFAQRRRLNAHSALALAVTDAPLPPQES
jgi:glycosyltransferase involved in cell wall biosynthesis